MKPVQHVVPPAQPLVAPLSRHAIAINSCPAAFSYTPKSHATPMFNGFPLLLLHSAHVQCKWLKLSGFPTKPKKEESFFFLQTHAIRDLALLDIYFETLALCSIQGFTMPSKEVTTSPLKHLLHLALTVLQPFSNHSKFGDDTRRPQTV